MHGQRSLASQATPNINLSDEIKKLKTDMPTVKTTKLNQKLVKNTGKIVNPLEHEDFFELNPLVKMEDMFK